MGAKVAFPPNMVDPEKNIVVSLMEAPIAALSEGAQLQAATTPVDIRIGELGRQGFRSLDVHDLEEPIQINLTVNMDRLSQSMDPSKETLACAYWDESGGSWSRIGVKTVSWEKSAADSSHLICATTHLTLFSGIRVTMEEMAEMVSACSNINVLSLESLEVVLT